MQRDSICSMAKYVVILVAALFISLTNSACTPADEDYDNSIPEYMDSRDIVNYKPDENPLIVVAHWNIGHFSKGKAPYTTIATQETDSLKKIYQDFINQAGADIFGLCEYNPTFNVGGDNTADLLFPDFDYSYILDIYAYNCNSVFSHLPLYNCHQINFSKCIQRRYYTVTDVVICKTLVKFIETHLDFNQGSYGNSYRLSQMKDLVEAFNDSPYVIICADYNSSYREEYDVFRSSGYSFATDSLPNAGSTTSDTTRIMIDNILVKGFEIKETKVFPHKSLSDHNMICSKFLLKRDIDLHISSVLKD